MELREGTANSHRHGTSETIEMNVNSFFVQYGEKTLNQILEAVSTSFKIFWDGSLSQFDDTIASSTNNKHFLNRLLDLRTETATHYEPPITLVHGEDTESTLKKTLTRIKIEQQEELEEMKARAAEQEGSDQED